jgi:hypothetical protein
MHTRHIDNPRAYVYTHVDMLTLIYIDNILLIGL